MLDPHIADGTGCEYIGTMGEETEHQFMLFNEPKIHSTIAANTREELLFKMQRIEDAFDITHSTQEVS